MQGTCILGTAIDSKYEDVCRPPKGWVSVVAVDTMDPKHIVVHGKFTSLQAARDIMELAVGQGTYMRGSGQTDFQVYVLNENLEVLDSAGSP